MSDQEVPGVELETVEIRLRLSQVALDRLTTGSVVPVRSIWLTKQLDGTYALGVSADVPAEELGLPPRKVDVDERGERVPGERVPGRPRPDFDPHLDYPERYSDGPY